MAGAPGTTAALALLNDAVKKGGVMASYHVGGLSAARLSLSVRMIGMIAAASSRAHCYHGKAGSHDLRLLRGPGYDRRPGNDDSAATISGIIADEAAIGVVNNKTTAVRIIPVIGKKTWATAVEFGGLLGYGAGDAGEQVQL